MLQKLLKFSLNNSALIVLMAVVTLGVTGYFLPQMPVDVFPELNAPRVLILTEAGGYSAAEVKQYVTFPIESTVNGLPGVQKVRSSSAGSLSLVWVEFDWGEDIYRARQLVAERLAIAREDLPDDIHAEIAPITSITGEIMLVSLSSPDRTVSPLELRSIGEYELRNKLLGVSGVSQVVAIGGELPEYRIQVKEDRLRLYNLTLNDVIEAASNAHSTESAGYLTNVKGLELSLRQTGRVQSVEDIKNTLIRYENGVPLTVGQVADVTMEAAPSRGAASDNGNPAVVLSIQKGPGTNTLKLTDDVDKVLSSYAGKLPKGVKLNTHAFRQADFINRAIGNVTGTLRDAAILVAIILMLFLMNARTTIITLTALPLSLSIALLALWAMGLTINVMTLGGLAVAIGELVDDAIIDVENCVRRLRSNMLLPEAERDSFLWIVYDSSNEIRSSVVFATIIIGAVFVPLLFLQGLEGRFFRPLGTAYIVALMASLLVALTVTPVMCKLLLRKSVGTGKDHETKLVLWLKSIYKPLLELTMRWRKSILALSAVATVIAMILGSTFGTSFLPRFNEGTFTAFLMAPPGTSLEESDRVATSVEKKLKKIKGVKSVTRRTGRAEKDEHAEPVSSSEIDLAIEIGADRDKVRLEIDKVLKSVAGLTTMIGQPIEHRLSHVLSGTKASVAINIYGEDMETLRKVVKQIEPELQKIPEATDVAANREVLVVSAIIKYRPEDLKMNGLTRREAAEQVSAAFNGRQVSTINKGIRQYNLVIRLDEQDRENLKDVSNFVLRNSEGGLVKLSEVADVGPEETSNLLARENNHSKAIISCNVATGSNLGDLVAAVQKVVDPIIKKEGLSVSYGGQFEAQQSATKMLSIMAVLVLLVILMLLNTATGSMKTAMLVMVNLPLAIIGGVVAVFICESPDVWGNTMALFGFGEVSYQAPIISVASIVGYITLFGIAIRNGLLLVNRYSALIIEEKMPVMEAVIKGSLDRLVPILMTALVTVLGLVPLIMAAKEPGGELLAPLAVVGLGGLTTSSFLKLFVVPIGYVILYARKGLQERAEAEKIVD